MKKAVNILLIILLMVCACAIAACEKHVHRPNIIKYTEVEHWYECECGYRSAIGPHIFDEGSDVCSVCDYERPSQPKHEHEYGEYQSNDYGHWRECECGEKVNNNQHSLSGTTCVFCGYVSTHGIFGDYEADKVEGGFKITRYSGTDSDITIPQEFEGEKVIELGANLFADKTFITSVTVPDSIEVIGEKAFNGCSALTTVDLGSGVTAIGSYAFSGTDISRITVPDSVTSLGSFVFNNIGSVYVNDLTAWIKISHSFNDPISVESYSLYVKGELATRIVIPDGVTAIGGSAFNGCGSITSVNIQGKVTTIGGYAFYRCKGLGTVTLPDSLTTIGERAFAKTNIVGMPMPGSVTTIGDFAFSGCEKLTNITIPMIVKHIGVGIVSDCIKMYSLEVHEANGTYHSKGNCIIETKTKKLIAGCYTSNIPNDGSITVIGESAFYGCTRLNGIITLPTGIEVIENNAFRFCNGITEIVLGENVTTIGDTAFGGCSELTSINLPDSVTTIGNMAFMYCRSLTSITIPAGVTSIGPQAFINSGIQTIYYGGTAEQWEQLGLTLPEQVTVNFIQE